MTATLNFKDEPTRLPTGNSTEKIITRRYSDGSVLYLCRDCTFTSNVNHQRVAAHRGREHNGSTLGRPKNAKANPITMLEAALEVLKQQENDNTWKARALKAEKQLRTLRGLLKEA